MTPDSAPYDVTVIGSGPGGYVCAVRAAQLGLKTAIVEKEKNLGGTCLNVGCIPTKALLHTADLWSELQHAHDFGVTAGELRLDMQKLHAYRRRVVQKNAKGVEFLMKKNGIDVHRGTGNVESAGRVVVESPEGGTAALTTKHVVVACGSTPRLIPGFEFDGHDVISSDDALQLERVPQSMVVLGAGAVGVEFASIYARFGSQVTLIELLPRILPIEDEEVSAELERSFRKQGIKVMTGTRAERLTRDPRLTIVARDADGGEQRIDCEVLLVAVGRGPVSARLGLEAAGVEIDRGFVKVDDGMQTSVPGIYAIGDVVALADRPHPQLAHVASHEGILVAERIAGHPVQPINYERVPSCTYSYPEVASVGITEAEARKRGHDVRTGKFPFSANSKASILLENQGFVKIVADAAYDEVLGVHIVGPRATELIAQSVLGLRLEMTSEELFRTIHPHPTLSEAVMEAAHSVLGAPIHI